MSCATSRRAIDSDVRGAPGRSVLGGARSRWLSLVIAVIAPVVLLSGATAASVDVSDPIGSDPPAAQVDSGVSAAASDRAGKSPVDGEFDVFATSSNLAVAGDPSVFVPIAPYRMYDSRNLDGGNTDLGKWIVWEAFPLEALTDQWGYDQQIPSNATAVAFNIAAVGTEGSGYVQVYGPGTDPFSTSTVNWRQPGLAIANSGSAMLGNYDGLPGFMGIAVGGQSGARTHIIVDITGYYLPVS